MFHFYSKRMYLLLFVLLASTNFAVHCDGVTKYTSDWESPQSPSEQEDVSNTDLSNWKTPHPLFASQKLNDSTTHGGMDSGTTLPAPTSQSVGEIRRDNPGLSSLGPLSVWSQPSSTNTLLNSSRTPQRSTPHSAQKAGCVYIRTTSTLNGTKYPNRRFDNSLTFVTSQMRECFLVENHVEYPADKMQLNLKSATDLGLPSRDELEGNGTRNFLKCRITVTPARGRVFIVKRFSAPLNRESSCTVSLDIWKPQPIDTPEVGCLPQQRACEEVTIVRKLDIVLTWLGFTRPFSFRARFYSVLEREPELEIHYFAKNKGYIHLGLKKGSNSDPTGSSVRLAVPKSHQVLLSLHITTLVNQDALVINVDGRPFKENVHIETFYAQLIEANEIDVRFVKGQGSGPSTGKTAARFRLYFSFHENSQIPEQLPDGTWNCSVPHWPDFQLHFPCNMLWDCAAGEDERECPYTSDKCGSQVAAGSSCFRFLNGVNSAIEVWKSCSRYGMHLAMLKTPAEWKDIVRHLNSDYSPFTRWHVIYIGLFLSSPTKPPIYRNTLEWLDGTTQFYNHLEFLLLDESKNIAIIHSPDYEGHGLQRADNMGYMDKAVLCEAFSNKENPSNGQFPLINKANEGHTPVNVPRPGDLPAVSFIACPAGHLTHSFLACEAKSACYKQGNACLSHLTHIPPLFTCASEIEHVPYTFVCNFRSDCSDDTDENFCVTRKCGLLEFHCGTKQCIHWSELCDGTEQCTDGSDELNCVEDRQLSWQTGHPPPAVISYSKTLGYFTAESNRTTTSCPETHFQCPGDGYCLPVFLRCNGVYDCPKHEDEAGCKSYTCPGFYRCRASTVCVHTVHVCDGMFQCPQHDDEVLCDLPPCPENCTCFGKAFLCGRVFGAGSYSDLRYVDASGTGMDLGDFASNSMLVYLNLARCGIDKLLNITLPNLQTLILRDNRLATLDFPLLSSLRNLRLLSISGNPLSSFLTMALELVGSNLALLKTLDMSRIDLPQLDLKLFDAFPQLQALNLSGNTIDRILSNGFHLPTQLRIIDFSGSTISTFPLELFQGLEYLEVIRSENYKLCCPKLLTNVSGLPRCHAPRDLVSSCEFLLRSKSYTVFVSVSSTAALLGNIGRVVIPPFVKMSHSKDSAGVFLTHLSVSEFLMGVYLAVLGVADRMYQLGYLWNDTVWRRSGVCKAAGFLAILSIQMSTFCLLLATVDRFLAFFSRIGIQFRVITAHCACALAWGLGMTLAFVPLLPATSHWQVLSKTSICLPVPFSRHYYFSGVLILNLILTVLTAFLYGVSVSAVRSSNIVIGIQNTQVSNDHFLTRRLRLTVVTTVLCWILVSSTGFLSFTGIYNDDETDVAMVLVVLPLRSALSPYLLVLGGVLERRRLALYQRVHQRLVSKLSRPVHRRNDKAARAARTEDEAYSLFNTWLSSGVLSYQEINHFLNATEK